MHCHRTLSSLRSTPEEAWREVSQTDEVKRNLERLQPVIERVGY